MPEELRDAAWHKEVVIACPFSGGASGETKMNEVLEWLSTMLVSLELNEQDDELDELDNDFVQVARPWLHSKAFFDVEVDNMVTSLWSHLDGAEYLKTDGNGGTLILLMPSAMPFALLETVADSVSAAAAQINPEIVVSACHPESTIASARCPVPLLRVFHDHPELLVEGASMADAAGFL